VSPSPGAHLVAFDERFRFDTFVVGSTTRDAANAVRAVAEGAVAQGPPLVVAGPNGTGKSHLLGALVRRLRERRAEAHIVVVNGAEPPAEWPSVNGAHVVLVDDAHGAPQAPLAELLRDASTIGAQVVAAWTGIVADEEAARRIAVALGGRARIARLAGPDADARREIVRRTIVNRGLSLAASVADAIADREVSDVRDLLGAVTRSGAAAAGLRGAAPAPADAPPASGDPDFASFLDEIAREVAPHAEPWRLRLGEAATRWRGEGYAVEVLDRALRLATAPDVDALLGTFSAAIGRLRQLQADAQSLDAALATDAAFHDPARVADAEALVARARVRLAPPAPHVEPNATVKHTPNATAAAVTPRAPQSLIDPETWVLAWPDVCDLLVERWS
jgi:hypothetical protein